MKTDQEMIQSLITRVTLLELRVLKLEKPDIEVGTEYKRLLDLK